MKAIEARLGMAMTLLMVLDKGRKGNAWAWLDRDLGPGSEQVHIPLPQTDQKYANVWANYIMSMPPGCQISTVSESPIIAPIT